MGLMSCSVNCGLILTPIIYGLLKDLATTDGYYWVTRLSGGLAFIGVHLSILVYFYDIFRNNGILAMDVKKRKLLLKIMFEHPEALKLS